MILFYVKLNTISVDTVYVASYGNISLNSQRKE